MLISTQTGMFVTKFGQEEGIKKLIDAGFDCLDYSFFGKNTDYLETDGLELAKS